MIQDSTVALGVGASTSYLVNSEGTRLRIADTGVRLSISAEVQAKDGEIISDGRSYIGEKLEDFPSEETILTDIKELIADLTKAMEAPILENYSGPVLFEGIASSQVFQSLIAGGIAGRPEPVGRGRRRPPGTKNLEKRLGKRVLPTSFRIYDDPRVVKSEDTFLVGHYKYDDEGVKARRVELVDDGILKTMLMSRAPTKKLSGSTGHGRGSGPPRASVGCLFIEHEEGLSDAEKNSTARSNPT